jgi:hypothetical protein
MRGGLGNDVYFVDDAGDLVFENSGEGTDAVFATVGQTLSANVDTLVLQGSANLTGTGNGLDNKLFGNAGENTLNGGAGADMLTGNGGNDTFVFNAFEADGDIVQDFALGDVLQFQGYGPGTFTQIGSTNQWEITSAIDASIPSRSPTMWCPPTSCSRKEVHDPAGLPAGISIRGERRRARERVSLTARRRFYPLGSLATRAVLRHVRSAV